jgi:hypothetical protein
MPGLEGVGDVSDETIETLVSSEATAIQVLESLGHSGTNSAEHILKQVRICVACDTHVDDALSSLVDSVRARDGIDEVKAKAKVIAEFKAEMKLDSVEVVVVSDEFDGANVASVVLLRCPFSIAVEDLSLTTLGARSLYRVARFSDPLKYLIAQKFGTLFARFGMPGALEHERDFAVDMEDLT